MALTYLRKLSRSDLGAETLPCEGRILMSGGIDKFHMLRNPWSSNLYSAKPSEYYNPVWTGINLKDYNPRLSKHVISGDIEAWRRKRNEEWKRPPIIPVEPRPYQSFYLPPPESSSSSSSAPSTLSRMIAEIEHKKKEEAMREKVRIAKEKPHYMFHARCRSKHLWPLLNCCFPCEKVLQYKLFTKTLQIKRAEDEAKYRSKDPWEKRKLRPGTSPVHSYHPMQTCDDDYWPLQSKRLAKEKLEIYDRLKEALEIKKEEEAKYKEEHPEPEKEEKKWVTTDITESVPHHRKGIRNQGSPKATNRIVPLRTTSPVTLVPLTFTDVQKRADAIIRAPHCQGIPLHEKGMYSLDHIHPQYDHSAKYYPPGDLAFTPLHHLSRFQGLHSPRWRNKELYKTKRPHCTRYEGIHDVTRRADGTSYIHQQ